MHAQKQRIGYGITKAEAARIRQNMASRQATVEKSENEPLFSSLKKMFR